MSLVFDGPTVRALIAERGGVRTKPPCSGRYFAKPLTKDDKIKRLANGLDSAEEGQCWLWMRSIGAGGYGQITIGRQVDRPHRVSFRLAHGEIPPGLCVCHSCDVRRCINPAHLHIGTQAENLRECRERGRHFMPHFRGEDAYNAKLTTQDVVEIVKRIANGEAPRDIAKGYNVTSSAIDRIKRGKNWKHISAEYL